MLALFSYKNNNIVMTKQLRQVSLVLLHENDKILLAMKKRGFGLGLWNGAGGKQDPGETIEQTAIRECQEEINVTPNKLNKVGVINFYSLLENGNNEFDQQAHVYLCDDWDGIPKESEEMKPKWFDINKIPYDSMWEDDKYWLPLVLRGKKISAEFSFDKENKITSHKIDEVDKLK